MDVYTISASNLAMPCKNAHDMTEVRAVNTDYKAARQDLLDIVNKVYRPCDPLSIYVFRGQYDDNKEYSTISCTPFNRETLPSSSEELEAVEHVNP